jgi:Uma2 family endonuclease
MKMKSGLATDAIHVRRWTREEYNLLGEQGFFDPDEKLELLDGIIYRRRPLSSLHATGISMMFYTLEPLYSEGFHIRIRTPLVLGPTSEPEPDISVVHGGLGTYVYAHPTTAVLVTEVADRSLLHDRKRRVRFYARARIPEYWILNLGHGCLEVYREPKDGVYTSRTVLQEGDSVSPLSRPEVAIPIASLLLPK